MKTGKPKNLPASVRDRLLVLARKQGDNERPRSWRTIKEKLASRWTVDRMNTSKADHLMMILALLSGGGDHGEDAGLDGLR